jgi:acetyl-CoA carboxylase carboxyl transferase subunit alpha
MAHPEGFRKSLRLVQQAAKFHRPVISFIDTPGAHSGIDAEEGGQAWAIAGNLRAFAQIKTPIISVITGEGGSGGALAMVAGDALLMLENAVFSVVSPEGCAAILWKDASRASEAANAMKITASELLRLGLIDGIVTEPLGGAHRDHQRTAGHLRQEIGQILPALQQISPNTLIELRWKHIRSMGSAR